MGRHPVEVAVLRQGLHIGENLDALRDARPQQGEDGARHVGMAHDAVRLAEQFLFPIEAELAEQVVHIGNPALEVGLADDDLVLGKTLLCGGRQWPLHSSFPTEDAQPEITCCGFSSEPRMFYHSKIFLIYLDFESEQDRIKYSN